MMHHGNGGHGFTKGFFLGATMGALAALLLTPRSGRELRSRLSRSGERLRERAHDVASQIRERGESVVRKTRRAAESKIEDIRAASDALEESAAERAPRNPLPST